jgi:uncharacterized protein (TIGR00297 family)
MEWALRTLAGAAGSGCVAAVASRLGALRRSGAWAAAAAGTALFAGGGWAFVAVVGAFFITSSLLTRWEPRSPARAARSLDRAGRRWDQVVANGGVAALAALIRGLTGWPVALGAAAGAIAAATADTWGTELGRWSPTSPRMVTTGARVPHGTSGAITPLGTAASAAGSLLIGATAALCGAAAHPLRLVLAVTAAGFTGAFFDSILGATVEARWRWVGNSVINFLATMWGAGVVLLTARWWR